MASHKLVFVFLAPGQSGKPRRKVAVPIPGDASYSWEEFLAHVRQKLKIAGVRDVRLASTGQRVTALDELQDIDELAISEGVDVAASSFPTQGTAGSSEITPDAGSLRDQGAGAAGSGPGFAVGGGGGSAGRHQSLQLQGDAGSRGADEGTDKYTKRNNPLRRAMQRWLPALFAPSLPVSTRDAGGAAAGGKRKARGVRRSLLSPHNALALLAATVLVLTVLWFVLRAPTAGIR